MKTRIDDLIAQIQAECNHLGSHLVVDGDFGPRTQAAIEYYQGKDGGGSEIPVSIAPVSPPAKGAPWHDWFTSRLGWSESNHDKELSKGWQFVGLNYTTIKGAAHAWCGMALATALHAYGYPIPRGAAGAANWKDYGAGLDPDLGIPQGAICVIRHASGGHHVTTANRDHKANEKVLEALGGNQSNSIKVATYNVTGNGKGHDEIIAIRWPVKT